MKHKMTDWEYEQSKKQQRKQEKQKRINRKNRRDVWEDNYDN